LVYPPQNPLVKIERGLRRAQINIIVVLQMSLDSGKLNETPVNIKKAEITLGFCIKKNYKLEKNDIDPGTNDHTGRIKI